jgi:hypothetical protein
MAGREGWEPILGTETAENDCYDILKTNTNNINLIIQMLFQKRAVIVIGTQLLCCSFADKQRMLFEKDQFHRGIERLLKTLSL